MTSAGPQSTSMLFPADAADPETTTVALDTSGPYLPRIAWLGCRRQAGGDAAALVAIAGQPTSPLLPEHWRGLLTRPGLRGARLSPAAGQGWSPQFRTAGIAVTEAALTVDATDSAAGLALRTELESLAGGALRIRHTLTNTDPEPYLLDGLDVVVPVPDSHAEVLDFTGRHERERTPQRHPITDGLWLREGRQGRTALDAAMMLVTGPTGFSFADSPVIAVHVAWSGNVVLRLERGAANGTTIGGGEHLLAGEMVLTEGASYTTPWVHVVASNHGLDGVAAAFHSWLRTLPSHPTTVPVTLNVWEAVYFNHDAEQLIEIADRAASIGVERYVLDDGWFHLRRTDNAGLGDWWIDTAVWPEGLTPLIDHVRGLGMQFGLWFEPEMVNPDSDLYRDHPDWILATGDREPLLARTQQVLDLSRPEVRKYLFDQIHAVLSANAISYVKWDHNRDLFDAGSGTRGGGAAVHAHTLGVYQLLDDLRAAHPDVQWESCASGGGRIDLGILERAERVWTSDMTDAHSRQAIQRWTGQLAAPEYLGAHVSAPVSHQTGRTLSLDFRAATALFGAFGIEWDLTAASPADLASLGDWIASYKRFRPLLHTGRMVRIDSADPAVVLHGVVALDRSEALFAHVQMDESLSNRGVAVRFAGLDADRAYHVRWVGPVDPKVPSAAGGLHPDGPSAGVAVLGTVLASVGVWVPRRKPEQILLMHVSAVG